MKRRNKKESERKRRREKEHCCAERRQNADRCIIIMDLYAFNEYLSSKYFDDTHARTPLFDRRENDRKMNRNIFQR